MLGLSGVVADIPDLPDSEAHLLSSSLREAGLDLIVPEPAAAACPDAGVLFTPTFGDVLMQLNEAETRLCRRIFPVLEFSCSRYDLPPLLGKRLSPAAAQELLSGRKSYFSARLCAYYAFFPDLRSLIVYDTRESLIKKLFLWHERCFIHIDDYFALTDPALLI